MSIENVNLEVPFVRPESKLRKDDSFLQQGILLIYLSRLGDSLHYYLGEVLPE